MHLTNSECISIHSNISTKPRFYLIMGSLTGCFLDFFADSVWKWATSGTGSSPATSSSPRMAACWEKSMSCMKDMLRFRANSRSCKQSRKRAAQPRVYSSIMRPERGHDHGSVRTEKPMHAIKGARAQNMKKKKEKKKMQACMHVDSKRSDVTSISGNAKH